MGDNHLFHHECYLLSEESWSTRLTLLAFGFYKGVFIWYWKPVDLPSVSIGFAFPFAFVKIRWLTISWFLFLGFWIPHILSPSHPNSILTKTKHFFAFNIGVKIPKATTSSTNFTKPGSGGSWWGMACSQLSSTLVAFTLPHFPSHLSFSPIHFQIALWPPNSFTSTRQHYFPVPLKPSKPTSEA